MIDGATSRPFSANTNAISITASLYRKKIDKYSNEQYRRLKEKAEKDISSKNKESQFSFNQGQNSLFHNP